MKKKEMEDIYKLPLAKRTRLQWQQHYADLSSSRSIRRRLNETKADVESLADGSKLEKTSNEEETNNETSNDEFLVDGSEEETSDEDGSGATSKSNSRLGSSNAHSVDESQEEASGGSSVSRRKRHDDALLLVDDSEEEINNENGSESTSESNSRLGSNTHDDQYSAEEFQEEESHHSMKETDGDKEINNNESAKIAMKKRGYGSASVFITGTHTYFHYSSGDSDSDDTLITIDEEEESHHSMKETDGDKEIHNSDSAKIAMKNHGYGSASLFTTGTHTYFHYNSDDSDSDDTTVEILPKEEESDNDFPTSCKYHHETQNLPTEDDDEDGTSSSSESESAKSEIFKVLLQNKIPNKPTNREESPTKNTTEKVWSGSVNINEKNHDSVPITNMQKANIKPMNDSICIETYEKDKENVVKDQESLKPRSISEKDDGDLVDSLLNPIIANGDALREEDDAGIPLRFRFDDSEDESSSKETGESDMEGLFQEMNFALACEEIGSYKTPKVKDQEKDDENTETNPFKRCQRGDHSDIYLEEQIGLRCGICRAIILESRYVIPNLATYAPDKSKRSYQFDEQQFSASENMHYEAPDWHPLDIYKQSKGTVWELIPTTIRAHLYPHQQEGFKFLWENLAGTIELSRLHKLDPCGGGGCIISHAPGTGKTLLTIVFLESFLKKFPKCFPVIIAPVSMLLTWEAEFKKWQVGFSFLNINSSEILNKDKVKGKFKQSKDLIRAMKLSSWSSGGSVLGVSYSLFEKLAGDTENKNLKKMGEVLLETPGLVVLDEGHTPRNERSNILNVLMKLKTKKRVILSGTPFQNNFKELFNSLGLVRPSTAEEIMKEKMFAEMSQQKNRKKPTSGSASEAIEKLKAVISPFVHVHKGTILEKKLPGLIRSVIHLNPPPLQKHLINRLGNRANSFVYEHRVALMSVHPSLILHCKLSKNEENSMDIKELKKVRLQPDFGVKTRFVMELIRLSLSLDEKLLIFSQFIEPLKLLEDQINLAFDWKEGREIMIIEGKTHQKQRQNIIHHFNDPKSEVKVLLASTTCCSEGIHLIGASRVVLLDVVWNPSVERQAISRAYRLGQKKVVYTYNLIASGTTEGEKYDRQVEKGRLAEMVFSSSSRAGDEPKNDTENAIKLDDRILQQMVDHPKLRSMICSYTSGTLKNKQQFD